MNSNFMHICRSVFSKFKSLWLVYEYPYTDTSRKHSVALGNGWLLADHAAIDRYFGGNKRETDTLKKYLSNGSVGVVAVLDNQWACYAFMTMPGKAGPPHLPENTSGGEYYWIYSCHTKEIYRGKGLYKQALSYLVGYAIDKNSEAKIIIDTAADNIASRKAIVTSGFLERGVISVYNLWIPRITSLPLIGKWHTDQAHGRLQ